MKNQFGKTSELRITAEGTEGRTRLADVYFTAPFKVMEPFPLKGGLQVMLLSASAGVMAGDEQKFSFLVKEGSHLEFISQSFEKIHRMEEGCARRKMEVTVERGASFDFYPQPTIPFGGSAFESETSVTLMDETSRFGMYEIISCGRCAHGEQFRYQFYRSLIRIWRDGELIYRDNTRYEPDCMQMDGLGMYESYTHLANIFLTGNRITEEETQEKIRDLLGKTPDVEGALSTMEYGDAAIRILGKRAQTLQRLTEKIKEIAG